MIFQPSCFILHFIFSINSVVLYNDVTHFLTDSDENFTAYVKFYPKIFLFVELFWFSEYLLRKLRFITKIPSFVRLPYTSPPSPLGHPLGWVLLGTHLSHTWGYFKKNSFYEKWWKPGSKTFGPQFGEGPGVLVLVAPYYFGTHFLHTWECFFSKKHFCNFWLKFGVIMGSIPLNQLTIRS